MWNQNIFIKNILTLVDRHFDGNQKAFNSKIEHRDAVSKWKAGKRPNLEVFLRIVEAFPSCTTDWLLTGIEPGNPLDNCSEDVLEICKKTKEVIESKHPLLSSALRMNVEAFHYSLISERDKEDKIDDLIQEVGKLKEAITSPNYGLKDTTQTGRRIYQKRKAG